MPHVTVGLYADAWSSAEVADRFAQVPAVPRLHHRVTHLSLLSYTAAQIGGALCTLAKYELEAGRLDWYVRPASDAALGIKQPASVPPTL